MKQSVARRYIVRGIVQGVGFRYFVQQVAVELGVSGYVRNRDDGSVEVYSVANEQLQARLAAYLRTGPRWAEVRHLDQQEAAMLKYEGFRVEP